LHIDEQGAELSKRNYKQQNKSPPSLNYIARKQKDLKYEKHQETLSLSKVSGIFALSGTML